MAFIERRTFAHYWASTLSGIFGSCVVSLLLQNANHLTNIQFYFALCVAFFTSTALVFVMPCSLFSRFGYENTSYSSFVMTSIAFLIALLFLCADFLPLNTWGFDIKRLPWHSEWYRMMIGAIVAFFGGQYLNTLFRRMSVKLTAKNADRFFYAYALLMSLLCAYLTFQPNISSLYDQNHRNAYFFDIHNVYVNTPYSNTTSGIYGHYGLFFAPLLRLLGGFTIENVTLLVSCVSFLSSLLFSLSIANVSRNPVLRYVLPLAFIIAYYFVLPDIYYQNCPARILPSALFYYLVSIPESNRIWRIVRRLAAVLALLWSTEFGIVFIFAILTHDSIQSVVQQKNFSGILRGIIPACMWALAEIACAISIVNLYNLYLGGGLIFRSFFWPIGSTYDVEYRLFSSANPSYLQFSFLHAYYWIFAFLMGCFFSAVYCGIKYSKLDSVRIASHRLSAASIYGLGALVYYINRPAYGNLLTVLPSLLFCLAILVEGSFAGGEDTQVRPTKASQHVLLSLAVFLAINNLIALPNAIYQAHDKQKSTPYHQLAAKALQKFVPKNTYAFGVSSFEVYSAIGWDTLCRYDALHLIINPIAQQKLYADILMQTQFVDFHDSLNNGLGEQSMDLIRGMYEVAEVYDDGSIRFVYYRKKESLSSEELSHPVAFRRFADLKTQERLPTSKRSVFHDVLFYHPMSRLTESKVDIMEL